MRHTTFLAKTRFPPRHFQSRQNCSSSSWNRSTNPLRLLRFTGSFVLILVALELLLQASSVAAAAAFFGSGHRPQQQPQPQNTMNSRIIYAPKGGGAHCSYSSSSHEGWSDLDPDSLVTAPCLIEQTLCMAQTNNIGHLLQAQLAGTKEYAQAILAAWREEEEEDEKNAVDASKQQQQQVEWKRIAYTDSPGTPLYGYLVRLKPQQQQQQEYQHEQHCCEEATQSPTSAKPRNSMRGILLFHTGAGPHDIFLLWKAARLVRALSSPPSSDETNSNNNSNVVVFIADVLSDDGTGWAWNTEDRSRYNQARETLLQQQYDDNNDSGRQRHRRPVLQDRIRAAMQCLQQQHPQTDMVLAALGWCLGGQAIAEIARMEFFATMDNHDTMDDGHSISVPCMVTFHGVFAGLDVAGEETVVLGESIDKDSFAPHKPQRTSGEILICHGVQDPFVPPHDLENVLYV